MRADYQLNRILPTPTPIGVTQNILRKSPSGLMDRGDALRVKMISGSLQSIDEPSLLSGGNLCAIGDGTPDRWELFQFQEAELISENTYALCVRLRGQLGTETAQLADWPTGSYVIRLDGTPQQIDLLDAQRGLARHYRIGPAQRPVSDPSYKHAVLSFAGLGLRTYAPVHLRSTLEPNGDRTMTWVRRTRIGGDPWEPLDVPLGEEREQYLLRILKEGEVRREEIVESSSYIYQAADQLLDGVTEAFTVEVAQISASFGAGVFARLAQTE